MKTNRHYIFALNGKKREIFAPNLLSAMASICKAYPEVKKIDYRKIQITEIKLENN